MTINTTKDPRPDARSDMAVEPPITSTTSPGLGVSPAPSEPDLESRIKVRRAELVARLGELRADVRLEASEAGDKVKAKLSEVAHIIKEGVVDGWVSLGDTARRKLESWLAESARQPSTQNVPARTGQS